MGKNKFSMTYPILLLLFAAELTKKQSPTVVSLELLATKCKSTSLSFEEGHSLNEFITAKRRNYTTYNIARASTAQWNWCIKMSKIKLIKTRCFNRRQYLGANGVARNGSKLSSIFV